jgi:spore maturation protein A
MINIIWFILLFVGIIYSFIGGHNISDTILNSSYDALDMIMSIGPLVVLWSGIMNIANDSGLLDKLSNLISPLLRKLMPSVRNNKVFTYISSNIIANMLGLGSVATPAGLKAMKE